MQLLNCRWRRLLTTFAPLPVGKVIVNQSSGIDVLTRLPIATTEVQLRCKDYEDDDSTAAVAAWEQSRTSIGRLLNSSAFRRGSGASLQLLAAPSFELPADMAAVFTGLKTLRGADVPNSQAQLPPGLTMLDLEGDTLHQPLNGNDLSHLSQLKSLRLQNVRVDAVGALPCSLAQLKMMAGEAGPGFWDALQPSGACVAAQMQLLRDNASTFKCWHFSLRKVATAPAAGFEVTAAFDLLSPISLGQYMNTVVLQELS